jgi:ABC-type glycerol-3-phosphate transport system substrate-binding protein
MNTSSFANAVKRTLAGVSALVLLASAASCSAPAGNNGGSDTQNTASDSSDNGKDKDSKKSGDGDVAKAVNSGFDHTYESEEISGLPDLSYVENLSYCPAADKFFLTGYNEEEGEVIFVADSSLSKFDKIEYKAETDEHKEINFRTFFGNDGTVYLLKTITDFGDKEVPDFDSPDFDYDNFDYEEFYKDAVMTTYLVTLSDTGEVLSEVEITGLDKYVSEDYGPTSLSNIYPISDGKFIGNIYSDGEVYLLLNKDGEIEQELDYPDDTWFNSPVYDKDGNILALSYGEKDMIVCKLDGTTGEYSESDIDLSGDDLMSANAISLGNGDYTYYLSTATELIGLKADGSHETVINWTDSDISANFVRSVIPCDDGSFIVMIDDYMTGSSSINRLTKGDGSNASKEIITIGVSYPDTRVTSRITDFNKTSSDYKIKLVDYSKYYEYDDNGTPLNTAEAQMKLDIVAGNGPDILMGDPSTFTTLASKGVFEDLNNYLGKNGTVSKDDLVSNVLKIGEYDGKLISLTTSFNINTLACKKKYVDADSWTIADFMEKTKELPEGMTIFQSSYENTKESAFSSLCNSGLDFIDFEAGTSSFDSPEFVQILEFCNTLPEEAEEVDWDSMTPEEMRDYSEKEENAVRNDKALLFNIYLSDFEYFIQSRATQFEGEMNLIGFPTTNGSTHRVSPMSSFSILSSSEHKDVCWDFISSFFTEEFQESRFNYGLPALQSSLDKRLDDTMKDPYWVDDEGKKESYKRTAYIGGKDVDIPNFTKEERDELAAFIESVGAGSSYRYEAEVNSIINEEVSSFFSGFRSAQETADLIQNRVSILVSEQS